MKVTEVSGRDDRTVLDRLRREVGQAHVVALDEDGARMDSDGFARHLDGLLTRHAQVAFLVGIADGYPDGTEGIVNEKLSLSDMTLPHRLARILILEQIYRATAILHGEPYHR